jgi:cytosine/uracil/thiamine/allantoin permease
MLTSQQLTDELSHALGKIKVLKLTRILEEQHFALRDLIDITFHQDKVIGFRAVWILENMFLKDPEHYIKDLEYFASRFKEVSNPSCMRHYTKLIMHMTDTTSPASVKLKLETIDLDPVVEQLFDWMIDPKIKVAVKAFAGKALFNLKDRYDWIAEELEGQLKIFLCDKSAGMRSAARTTLKLIQK